MGLCHMEQLLIKMEGQFGIFREKCNNFLLTTPICMNEVSLVAYDFRELHKKSTLKKVKYECVRGCPK
jgi:hypothetical protein